MQICLSLYPGMYLFGNVTKKKRGKVGFIKCVVQFEMCVVGQKMDNDAINNDVKLVWDFICVSNAV